MVYKMETIYELNNHNEVLYSQLQKFCKTRDIKYDKDKNKCIDNIKDRAENRFWKLKTLQMAYDFTYNIFMNIDMNNKKIMEEQQRVASIMEQKLNNLDTLNEYLNLFKLPKQNSKNKAIKCLKKVYINIFDLDYGFYNRIHNSKKELKKYTFETDLVFPREIAKGTSLKAFLQKF